MVKIDRFSNFNIRTLYVFDFDDTIVVSPRYEDIALEYLSENLKVKDLIDRAIKSIGIEKSQLKFQDGRIFVEDPNNNYNQTKDWTRKGTRLYLIQPDEFCYLDESLPKKLKEVSDIYNQSKDKCIVTARPEGARDKIVSVLNKLNLKFPKYGLHMRPDFLKNAGSWKGEKIVELAKKYNFNKVVFYDDNSKYIRKAKKVVSEKMPELEFITIKV
jgi:hypothetical protein